MTVASILKTKGSSVVTIQRGHRMREAAKLLTEQRIGAVIVVGPEERVVGILSERDIVGALAATGAGALDSAIDEFMSTDVRVCQPDDSIERVMQVMTSGRCRHLPVIDDGKLIGIVSIGDVVKRRIDDTEHEAEALKRYIVAG